MKKGKVAQDIAALEQPLRPLSLRVNEYTSEPELCMGVDSGAEVTVWPPELFPAEVAKCEVLRTGRHNHSNTSQSLTKFNTVSNLAICSRKQVSTLCQCGNRC